MRFDPLQDGKSKIELIDSMGDDLSVVNDARVSYDRTSAGLTEKDEKLINYLIKDNHSSPLRGVVFKFKVKAPLFVVRQWWKHVIASNHNDEQLGWNEKSFRYVALDDQNEFYIPREFRMQDDKNKQSSKGNLSGEVAEQARLEYEIACDYSFGHYKRLLNLGVCREQARGVLNPACYTTFVWTVSLQAVLHFVELRDKPNAQLEIQKYAFAIEDLIAPIVPVTMKYWKGKSDLETK